MDEEERDDPKSQISSVMSSPEKRSAYSCASLSLEFEDYPLDLVVTPIPEVDEPSAGTRLSWNGNYNGQAVVLREHSQQNGVLRNGHACPISNIPVKTLKHNSYIDDLKDFDIKTPIRGRCKHCRRCCLQFWLPCMAKHHPLAANPTPRERCRHMFLCPPHGPIGHILVLSVCTLLIWGTLWALTGHQALPGGNLFALVILVVTGYAAGAIVKLIKLPPLLGMLIAGCVLRNVPNINIAKDIEPHWAAALRLFALVIILLRAGLGLDPRALRKLSFVVLRLAFLPCIFETITVAIATRLLLDFPWLWGFMLGFVLSAVTPAVVVPSMLALQERGYGVRQGIPTLVIAAASVDDVLAITGFTVILGVVFSQGSLIWTIFRGPLEALLGIAYGLLLGLICWFLPNYKHRHVSFLRCVALLSAGMFAAFGSQAAGIPGAGALGCLITAFSAAVGWRRIGAKIDEDLVNGAMEKLWWISEPLLFGLIGAEVDISKLTGKQLGLSAGVIVIGSLVRMLISYMSVCGTRLSTRERCFIPLAWLPKATVQAAIGSVALDTARAQGAGSEQIQLGMQIVNIAVLVILLMAPVGGALIAISGPRLLRQNLSHSESEAEDEEEDAVSVDRQDLTWDDHLDFDTELTKMKVDLKTPREVMAERETVT